MKKSLSLIALLLAMVMMFTSCMPLATIVTGTSSRPTPTTPAAKPTTSATATTAPVTNPTTGTTATTVPTTAPTTETTVTTAPTTGATSTMGTTSTTVTKPTTVTTSTTKPTTTPTTKPETTTVIFDLNADWARYVIRPGYEDVNFDDYTFTFASPLNTTDGWSDYEVYADEKDTGILDSSIRERNAILKQYYNCNVAVEDIENGTLQDDFNTNRNRIDLMLTRYNVGGKANGQYYDFHSLNIDLNKPWWDQNFIDDLTINGQLYTMLGAFSLTSFDATWVMFFNKAVKEDNSKLKNIDFYKLVYDNEWTLDKFYELVKMAKTDDGDQEMKLGTNDIYGLVSSSFGIRGLYFGAGQSYVNKTDAKDGYTTFTSAFGQPAVEATNKIIEIYGDDATTITDYVSVERQMRNNRVLFSPDLLRMSSTYLSEGKYSNARDLVDFGILPHPKLNAAQEGYKHNVDNHFIYMCVPKTCANLDRISKFLELYAYHSYYTVYKDYLDLYQYHYTTDIDSAAMVDEILKSRYFDIGYHFSLASIDSEYASAVEDGHNLILKLGDRFADAIVESANTWKNRLPGNNNVQPPKPTTGTVATTTPIPGTTSTSVSTTPITKPTTGTTQKPAVPNVEDRPGYENVDFGGHTFTFASPINTTDGWNDYEVYAEEDGTGYLDTSIRNRNAILENNYNCKVAVEDVANGTLQDDFNTSRNRIDLLLTRYSLGGKTNGMYYNFHELDIDFDKPWWDRSYIEDVTVNGQLYAMLGAFSLTSFDATWVMYFNNTVKENNASLKNINFYDLVYNNEWTLDKFYEIVKLAKSEDGDGMMIYGFASTSFGIRGLYFGAGQKYLDKTDSKTGATTFSHAFNQSAFDTTNKIIDIFANDATIITNYMQVETQMRNNKVLFAPEVLKKAQYYAGKMGDGKKTVDFGILPHPKLSAAQEEYGHYIDNHMIYMCVPRTCTDLTRISQFLEVYAYHSYYTVYQDYINYHSEITGNKENGKMVDLILQSRYFDLCYHFNFASVDGDYASGVQNGTNLVIELGAKSGPVLVSAANTWRDKLPPIKEQPSGSSTTGTTVTTTPTVATTVTTIATVATTPITPGSVYVDIDFDYDNNAITDKKGNVVCTPVGQATVEKAAVTHNGATVNKDVLSIVDTAKKSWVECTFKNIVDYAQLNKLVEEMKGWTVEAFYLNADKTNVTGIVCATEGNGRDPSGVLYGKQGWGIADNRAYPYYIFGTGENAWSTTSQTTNSTNATDYVHVMGVYDAVAKTNTLYINGVAVKSVVANGFAAAQATSKDGFVMGRGFFIGADPTSTPAACDYGSSNLKVADVKIYAGALTAAQVNTAYQNATAGLATTAEEIFFNADERYNLDNYSELEFTPTLHAYYNSTAGTELITNATSTAVSTTTTRFFTTPKFTKEQLPVGSVIVIANGFQYRPDGWQTADKKNSGIRPSTVTTQIVVVDEAWWSDYTLRAFNVSTSEGRTVSEKDYSSFKIYVPR